MDYLEGRYCYLKRWWALIALLIIFWERPVQFACFFASKEWLEELFVSNKSLYIYFVAIFVTVWAVLIPSTKIAWRVFKDLPEPPADLKQGLNFTE